MSRFAKLLFIAFAAVSSASAAWAAKTQNVILVIADGVRWQEVFTGVDASLLTDAGGNWIAGMSSSASTGMQTLAFGAGCCSPSCGRP
jgi:hypothetical protein